jgi:ribosomal peptide maturation radical SAM protein 1
MERRVLLISPPWQAPYAGSLALATLRPLLMRHGIAADELHGSLLFPPTPTPFPFLEQFSAYLFAPVLSPQLQRGDAADLLIERYRRDCNVDGLLYPDEEATLARLGIDGDRLRAELLADMERAALCVERCVERALAGPYDVIGLSATFESQLPAALAIARRLREHRQGPGNDLAIILGGAACFETQGEGLAASFPFLSAVCLTEGESVIVPLVTALREGAPLSAVPGIAFRDRGLVRRTASPPLIEDLDAIPVPDYAPFLAQLAASPFAGRLPPKLFFETSRGCWWGQKHLCTFCGLNAEGLPFRRKSPARAVAEIADLYERYEARYLQATDNILDQGYLRDVMPALARLPRAEGRPLQIFYEVKTSLRREQIQALADAGVVEVQPGVESFSDEVLRLMDKGATGLQQVQFIKWAYEAGIGLIYNLLLRNPGEQAAWYRDMAALIPTIEHLPPPTGVAAMKLERFSRYHGDPARFGLRDVRPMAHYRALYPDPRVDVARIGYVFEYEHPLLHDEELRAAHRDLLRLVTRWQDGWRDGRPARPASYEDHGDRIVVRDRRGGVEVTARVGGAAAEVFRYLDRVREVAAINRRFPSLDPQVLGSLLATWEARRWLCRRGDRCLIALPRSAA